MTAIILMAVEIPIVRIATIQAVMTVITLTVAEITIVRTATLAVTIATAKMVVMIPIALTVTRQS